MNHQSSPHKKANPIELAERVSFVAELLSHGERRGAIHRLCAEKWGVSWRTTDTYVVRAREAFRKAASASIEDMVAESKAFYDSVLSNPKATVRDKLFARQRLDELFGLDAPTRLKHEVSGPNGGAIQTEADLDLSKLNREQLIALEGIIATQNEDSPTTRN